MIKKILIISILTFISFVIFYFSISLFFASQIVSANHSPIKIVANTIGTDYQDVSIKTPRGNLYGWLFKGETNKLIIMVSGFKQNRVNEEYYTSLITKELLGLGYNVLLYDNQATGQSYGNFVTFGVKESKDIISVVNYAYSKGFEAKNIGIIADSTGATALLLASDKLNDIGVLIVDSPASNIKKLVENILHNNNQISPLFNWGVFETLKTVYSLDVNKIRPQDSIKKTPNRLFLFLHGTKDYIIYPVESKILWASANPSSKLVYFENARHVQTYINNPKLYRDTVFSFLSQHLK